MQTTIPIPKDAVCFYVCKGKANTPCGCIVFPTKFTHGMAVFGQVDETGVSTVVEWDGRTSGMRRPYVMATCDNCGTRMPITLSCDTDGSGAGVRWTVTLLNGANRLTILKMVKG